MARAGTPVEGGVSPGDGPKLVPGTDTDTLVAVETLSSAVDLKQGEKASSSATFDGHSIGSGISELAEGEVQRHNDDGDVGRHEWENGWSGKTAAITLAAGPIGVPDSKGDTLLPGTYVASAGWKYSRENTNKMTLPLTVTIKVTDAAGHAVTGSVAAASPGASDGASAQASPGATTDASGSASPAGPQQPAGGSPSGASAGTSWVLVGGGAAGALVVGLLLGGLVGVRVGRRRAGSGLGVTQPVAPPPGAYPDGAYGAPYPPAHTLPPQQTGPYGGY